jgi:hypothetical protein
MYRYRMVQTHCSSDRYGACEVCRKFVSDVWHMIEERRYQFEGRIGFTQQGCKDLFGHKECLESEMRNS